MGVRASEMDSTEGETDELVAVSSALPDRRVLADAKPHHSRMKGKHLSSAESASPRPFTRSQRKRLYEEEVLTAQKRIKMETSPLSMGKTV